MIGKKLDISSQVAEISTWSNNCAVSCTATFLVNALLQKRLSEKAEETLLQLFNDYYKTYFLSIAQLHDIFSSVITLPADRQIILGPVLREFIYTRGIVAEEGNMLSNEAFHPLAEAFDFNVFFYADRDKEYDRIVMLNEGTDIPPDIDSDTIILQRKNEFLTAYWDGGKQKSLRIKEYEHVLILNKGDEIPPDIDRDTVVLQEKDGTLTAYWSEGRKKSLPMAYVSSGLGQTDLTTPRDISDKVLIRQIASMYEPDLSHIAEQLTQVEKAPPDTVSIIPDKGFIKEIATIYSCTSGIHTIEKGGTIPDITVNRDFPLALRPYYHHNHYDLIMDDLALAQEHNKSSSEVSRLDLAIERGGEETLRKQVNGFISDRYNPEQQQILYRQIDILFGLAKNFQSSGSDDIAEDVTILASGLKELSETFFKTPTAERPATIEAFKQKSMILIQSVDKKIGGTGVLSWGWSFANNTERQNRQLHAALCALKSIIISIESENLEAAHASKKEEAPWKL